MPNAVQADCHPNDNNQAEYGWKPYALACFSFGSAVITAVSNNDSTEGKDIGWTPIGGTFKVSRELLWRYYCV
jgi:hypothetical protein